LPRIGDLYNEVGLIPKQGHVRQDPRQNGLLGPLNVYLDEPDPQAVTFWDKSIDRASPYGGHLLHVSTANDRILTRIVLIWPKEIYATPLIRDRNVHRNDVS